MDKFIKKYHAGFADSKIIFISSLIQLNRDVMNIMACNLFLFNIFFQRTSTFMHYDNDDVHLYLCPHTAISDC